MKQNSQNIGRYIVKKLITSIFPTSKSYRQKDDIEYAEKLIKQYNPKHVHFGYLNNEQIKQFQYKLKIPREKIESNFPQIFIIFAEWVSPN